MRPGYYPAFLNLRGTKCIVAGGGKVAERKISALVKAGAYVCVISPDLTAGLEKIKSEGRICHISRDYRKGDAKGAFLAIAATSSARVNKLVAEDASFLVNVVDSPKLSTFIAPAIVARGPLTIAVSTGGSSPAIAAEVRRELEQLYGKGMAQYLVFLRKLRKEAIDTIADDRIREAFLRRAASKEALGILREEGFEKVREKVLSDFSSVKGKK